MLPHPLGEPEVAVADLPLRRILPGVESRVVRILVRVEQEDGDVDRVRRGYGERLPRRDRIAGEQQVPTLRLEGDGALDRDLRHLVSPRDGRDVGDRPA
ncbi:MAG: hypothetical protein ABIQ01_03500 [Pseudolysinimonas sp.]